MRTIWASHIREYIFCPWSLGCRMRGIKPSKEAQEEKQARCDEGNRFHREHGEAVCMAEKQLVRGGSLIRIGMAAAILGGLAWLYFRL